MLRRQSRRNWRRNQNPESILALPLSCPANRDHLNLAYPLILKYLPQRTVVILLFLFVIAGSIVRWVVGAGGLFSYLGCFEQIAMGCIAAFCVRKDWLQSFSCMRFLLKIGPAIWIFTFLFLFSPTHYVIGPSLIGVGTALFLIALSSLPKQQPSYIGQLFAVIGSLSYEIYLIHLVFLQLMRQYGFDQYSSVLQRIGADFAVWPLLGVVTLLALLLSRAVLEPIRARIRSYSAEMMYLTRGPSG